MTIKSLEITAKRVNMYPYRFSRCKFMHMKLFLCVPWYFSFVAVIFPCQQSRIYIIFYWLHITLCTAGPGHLVLKALCIFPLTQNKLQNWNIWIKAFPPLFRTFAIHESWYTRWPLVHWVSEEWNDGCQWSLHPMSPQNLQTPVLHGEEWDSSRVSSPWTPPWPRGELEFTIAALLLEFTLPDWWI